LGELEDFVNFSVNLGRSLRHGRHRTKKFEKSGAKRGKVVDKGGSWGAKWRT
jgi:hypothetical protein